MFIETGTVEQPERPRNSNDETESLRQQAQHWQKVAENYRARVLAADLSKLPLYSRLLVFLTTAPFGIGKYFRNRLAQTQDKLDEPKDRILPSQ